MAAEETSSDETPPIEAEPADAAESETQARQGLPAALDAVKWWRVPLSAWLRGERRGSLWFAAQQPAHVVRIDREVWVSTEPLSPVQWEALVGTAAEATWPLAIEAVRTGLAAVSAGIDGDLALPSRTVLEAVERDHAGPTFAAVVAVDDAPAQGWWGAPTDGRAMQAIGSGAGVDAPSHLLMRGEARSRRPHVQLGSDAVPEAGLHLMWWPDGLPTVGRAVPEEARHAALLRPSLLLFVLLGVLASFVIPLLRGQPDYIGRGWPNLLFGGLFAGAALALFAGLLWRARLDVWVPDGDSMRVLGEDEDLAVHLELE